MAPETSKEIPEDCWESIFNFLPNQTHFQPLSLVSKQFLSITNRLRVKFSITNPPIPTLITKRFPNLKTLDFSNYTGNVYILLLGIANCCELSELIEIDLSNLGRVPIRGLKEFGGIRVLKCSNLGVLSDGDLVAIGNLGFLEELDISYPRSGEGGGAEMPVTDFGIRVLSSNVGNLRRINVSGNHFITNKSLVYLSENCVFLEGVDVVDCTLVTVKGVLFLLRNSVRLSSISVSGIYTRNGSLGDGDLSCVGERRLCSLDFRYSSLSKEFIQILVKGCVDLKRLKIVDCRELTVSSLELLLGRCQLQHLALEMRDCFFFDSVVQLFPYLRNLVSLQLNVMSTISSTFYVVANRFPLLESVEMACSCCGITSSRDLVKYANIRSLNLSFSCFGENKCLRRKCLRRIGLVCPNLERLHLSNCLGLTEECLVGILDACREMRHLSIAGWRFNSIGEGLELPKLEVLNAARSDIDDEGLVRIAIRCPRLVKLDLAGCIRVTDSGIKAVLGTCKILREISLVRCWNVNFSMVDLMLCIRPSLMKIVPPSYASITERQKRFHLRHGCQIVDGSKTPRY